MELTMMAYQILRCCVFLMLVHLEVRLNKNVEENKISGDFILNFIISGFWLEF